MSKGTKPRPGLKELLKKEVELSKEEKIHLNQFWFPIVKEKSSIQPDAVKTEKYIAGVGIEPLDFYEFLYNEGFRRFDHNDDCFYVRIFSGRVLKRVTLHKMQDVVSQFIRDLPETMEFAGMEYKSRQIESIYVQRINSLFDNNRLKGQLRPREEIVFNQDTEDTKFMYFQNGYLEINADTIRFKEYKTLKGFIWDSEMLNIEYNTPKYVPEKEYVRRFMLNICGKNEKRFFQLMNITGYLMHNYINYERKCVLLTDGMIDPEGEANGGSGKSLYTFLVGGSICNDPKDPSIKSFVNINGKDFDPNDKHKYAAADIDTKLIVLNDLKRYFDVDSIYNDITEGITVDKKSLHPFRINAKLIVTTNKTVKVEGGSSKRRFVEFEFSDHYNERFSPYDEFGVWFFRDWNEEDYCRYYNFMAQCAHKFLKDGKLASPDQVNLNKRKLIETTDPDFLEFVKDDWIPEANKLYEKGVICAKFLNTFPDFAKPEKKFSQNKFSLWVKNLMNYSPEWENFSKVNNDIKLRADDGTTKRYYKFIKTTETL